MIYGQSIGLIHFQWFLENCMTIIDKHVFSANEATLI